MLLKLDNVSKYYDNTDDHQMYYVLKDLTLEVNAGESLAVIGPSGSGKSTLLNIIGLLDRPSSGKVLLDGNDISQFDDNQQARVRNREIGFVFQLHHLLPQCTVLENVLIPTLASNKGDSESNAHELLERIGLKDRIHYRPGKLSGGERQRVAVIRALINHPKLLLADEPTGSLDNANAVSLVQLLRELNQKENVTLIMVTHSLELASQMSRIFELRDNKLVEKCSLRYSGAVK
ncbi:MAG: lipoprotein-releasing system ATP-binding protein [Candidatus Poribacteria bacterium]|nr:lipoprotein-releasing system ATP-binding protein [Candidatus Poribacteria bacterium]